MRTFKLPRNIKTLSKLRTEKYNRFRRPCIRFIKYDKRHVKVFKSAVRRALEHDAVALEITRKSINLRFSAAMHENHLLVYKLIGALTSDEERGSVQDHRREHKHSRAGGSLRCSAAELRWARSVDGDVPAHAALLENGWGPAGD